MQQEGTFALYANHSVRNCAGIGQICLLLFQSFFLWCKHALIWPSALLFYRTTATEGNRYINISRQHQTPPIPHVQLVLLLRPFKTQQRVTKWCSVSLIELRPIINKSLAVAFLFLVPGRFFSPVFSPFQGFTASSQLLSKDLHGVWQRNRETLRGDTLRLPLQLRPKHGYFGGRLSGELSLQLWTQSTKLQRRSTRAPSSSENACGRFKFTIWMK